MDELFTQTRRTFLIPDTIRLPLTEVPEKTWAEYFNKELAGVTLESGERVELVADNVQIVSPQGRFKEVIAIVKDVITKINKEIDARNEEKLRIIQTEYSAY